MAHYILTASSSGRCLQKLVETTFIDPYNPSAGTITVDLGTWHPCDWRTGHRTETGLDGNGVSEIEARRTSASMRFKPTLKIKRGR